MHAAYVIAIVVWLAACLPAVVWGGRPERIMGAVLLTNLALEVLLAPRVHNDDVQWWSLAIDTAVFAAMLITLRADFRRWLVVAAGFQFVALLVHVPRALDPRIHWWAYIVVNNYSGFAVVLALLVGTVLYRLRGAPDADQPRL